MAVALVFAGYWVSLEQNRAAAWVSHTHEVLTTIARTRAAVVDIQNGHRGYTISGREEDLEPYRSGRAAIAAETARLRALLADSAAQRQRLAELERILVARLDSASQLVEARRAGGFDAAKAIVDTRLPDEQMAHLRVLLEGLETQEEQLLRERLADHERRLRWFWAAMASLVVLLVVGLGVLYLLVRRHRTAREALLASEHRFHLMTSSVLDYAIVMLDLEGRVATWNMGAERISGYRAEDILGRDFASFYLTEDVQQQKPGRTLQAAASQGRFSEEGWLARRDGSAFWASIVMTPLRDSRGESRGFSMIVRDLTEHRRSADALRGEMQERMRAEEKLQRLNRSLEALVQERTAELSNSNAELLDAKLRLRDLSSQLISAQEQERRDIARELDGTGQSLTVIRMDLMQMLRGADGAAARMPDCVAVVDAAIAHIRAVVQNLRPTMLDDLDVADALEWTLEQQAKAAGWKTVLECGEVPHEIPAGIRTACFRIAQEALSNAARHAGASDVKVQLRMAGEILELIVSDNGAGFDVEHYRSAEERRKHFGLMSMEERAGLVGGSFEIDAGAGRGTRIRARFPISVAAGRDELDRA
ncbi:MAG: CHASE3 domain-containing protein [Ramlibacter sp.]|nr:CHASE3 domain-containing protein [Ramlibacter sp.]